MAKYVQMAIDWTQAARLPAPTLESTERTEQGQPMLPGMPVKTAEAPSRRPRAELPVPKPLRSAVARGHFGEDERGPVKPSRNEVRAITEHHAEKLLKLLEELEPIERRLAQEWTGDRRLLIQQRDRLLSAYQGGLGLYTEDFGQHAANRLDAYIRNVYSKR